LAAFPDDDLFLRVFFFAMIPFFINHSTKEKTAFGLIRDEVGFVFAVSFISKNCGF
jgi:hypothetical protein